MQVTSFDRRAPNLLSKAAKTSRALGNYLRDHRAMLTTKLTTIFELFGQCVCAVRLRQSQMLVQHTCLCVCASLSCLHPRERTPKMLARRVPSLLRATRCLNCRHLASRPNQQPESDTQASNYFGFQKVTDQEKFEKGRLFWCRWCSIQTLIIFAIIDSVQCVCRCGLEI